MPAFPRIRRAHLLLLCIALPFVVGFDMPDSSGTYAKVSGGRGTYHLTGCTRDFDSEFYEGQVSMRHSFNTKAVNPEAPGWKKLLPQYTTVGYHGDFIVQDLTVVKDSAQPSTLGQTESARAFEGGGYLGLDWKWVGVNAGFSAVLFNLGVKDAEKKTVNPIAGLRVGLTDLLYFSTELAGSNPYLTGGGARNAGLGFKFQSTRAWVGVGEYGWNGSSTLGILRMDQGYGPWAFSLAGQFGDEEIPPANLGIDREVGFSFGFTYRLSSLQ